MKQSVYVVGVGMTKFAKPGASEDYHLMAKKAGNEALKDAGLMYTDIDTLYAGYVYGDSACGQRAAYELGMTGIPIVNVNNNCSTGSSALYLARQAIEFGMADCVMALGFEKMEKGALTAKFEDRERPLGKHYDLMEQCQGSSSAPMVAQLFGGAGREYQEKYDIKAETFGKISVKARKHAANNPYALFSDLLSLDEIMASPTVYGPLTRFQCCPPTCGAAAAVLCSESFVKKHALSNSVSIAAQAMTTDRAATFDQASMMKVVGYDMASEAAQKVYADAGIDPKDIDVVELHDCFTTNELLTYEALGLCAEGEAERFICDEKNTYGGDVVVNPSGGLLSKGHPLGATGLAQCSELVWQLRGQADARQVQGAKLALQHNIGLGGACVVTLFQRT